MAGTGQAKIAILNGDQAQIDHLASILGGAGYNVLTPSSGLAGLALVTRENPDLIIIDLHAADMTGYTLLDILRAKSIRTPVLVATVPELISDNLAKQGVAGLLVKPIDPERLIMHVAAILEVQRVTREAGASAGAPAATPTATPAAAPKPAAAAPEPARAAPREKPLVLVVDDEPDMQTLLTDLLSFSGFEVATAGDGVEGIQQAQQKNPDVILLDIMLPKLDGFQMCRLLKFNEKYRDIPVIMLTARNHPKDRELAEAAGADGYIVKPFETKNLISEIKRAIETREGLGA